MPIFQLGKSGLGPNFLRVAVFKFRNMKSGQATPIPPGEFSVGRADDAYVHLDDASVSRRHAMVVNNTAGFFVEDLGSANGTAIRGAFITRRTSVNLGDLVYIGSVPFRIDPEVAGAGEVEADAAPSAGMRVVQRAYMRRDTERLPPDLAGSGRIPELISPEKLSAPEVAPTDAEAEDLNAITIREPASAPVRKIVMPKEEAPVAVAQAELEAPTPSASPSLRVSPEPSRPAQQLYQPSRNVSMQSGLHQPSSIPASAPVIPVPAPLPVAAPERTGLSWGWLVLIFLAGLGTGLFLGLWFARVFIEMGGKVAHLP